MFVDFTDNNASAPPLPILGAKCESAVDYTKKKNVMRLSLPDGSEYLFTTADQAEMAQWLQQDPVSRWFVYSCVSLLFLGSYCV